LIILIDYCSSTDLKYGIAVINAIKANIPLCPFAMANIVAYFRRIKSVDAPGANPAGKTFRVVYRVYPKVRAQQIPPPFVIQLWRIEKVGTPHRLDPIQL
jgi:hypothetical protein